MQQLKKAYKGETKTIINKVPIKPIEQVMLLKYLKVGLKFGAEVTVRAKQAPSTAA